MSISHLPYKYVVKDNISTRQVIELAKVVPKQENKQVLFKEPWFIGTGSLLMIMGILLIYGKWKFNKMLKEIKYEQYKVDNLHKRLKLALETIHQWEDNPDLVHSRDCNLDYLRMRMEEQTFHYAIINQVKIKTKKFISAALRISVSQDKTVGIRNQNGCKIDEIFDITYETKIENKITERVLFRIQIKLEKLPKQSTSETIRQLIKCIEIFLSPEGVDRDWQPAIQSHLVSISWNQQCKPTPLILLEQHNEGINVPFRSQQQRKKK